MTIFATDFLDLPLPVTPYKVFASIPFNITADIVRKMTGAENPPEDAWVFLQRDAAQRFLGKPRGTLISTLLMPWFELSVEHRFQRVDFVPPPRVDVVLLRFNKRGPPLLRQSERQSFRDFVVYGFAAWQPNVREAFRDVFPRLEFDRLARRFGLDPASKPGEISPAHWLVLHTYFNDHGSCVARQAIDGAENRLKEQQAGIQKSRRTRILQSQRALPARRR